MPHILRDTDSGLIAPEHSARVFVDHPPRMAFGVPMESAP